MEPGGFQLLITPIRDDIMALREVVSRIWEEQQQNSERLTRLEYLVEKLAIARGGEIAREEDARKRLRIECQKCGRKFFNKKK